MKRAARPVVARTHGDRVTDAIRLCEPVLMVGYCPGDGVHALRVRWGWGSSPWGPAAETAGRPSPLWDSRACPLVGDPDAQSAESRDHIVQAPLRTPDEGLRGDEGSIGLPQLIQALAHDTGIGEGPVQHADGALRWVLPSGHQTLLPWSPCACRR